MSTNRRGHPVHPSGRHGTPFAFLGLGLVVAAGSCTGSIDKDSPSPDPALPGGMLDPSTGLRSGPPSPDTRLRRLTRTEYKNSLRDLLKDNSVASNILDGDQIPEDSPFDNNADMLASTVVSPERYESVAAQVVEAAFITGSMRGALAGCGDETCARPVVSAFARRAWRRPVASDELDFLMSTAFDTSKADGIVEVVKLAFRMILVSPNFLYRVEVDPENARGMHTISPYELATRLSFFVWSSTPDDKLLAAADAPGEANLGNSKVYEGQLGRMLDDPRADAMADNFAALWLNTRNIATFSPDTTVFRSFDDKLRQAMDDEGRMFFREFLRSDRDITEMLHTDFTFANARLAKHYLIPGITDAATRKVPVPQSGQRFGILSQAGILMVTSNSNRTVPSRRGKWILIRLLCEPPGNPPPNVPTLPEDPTKEGLPANATIRQRLQHEHTTREPCASCHSKVDALGFGLEHYDGIGAFRPSYLDAKRNATDIDAGGTYNGTDFNGAEELSKRIAQDPRFLRCVARYTFQYALGRTPSAEGDEATVANLASILSKDGGRVRDLISRVASTNAFQKRGGTP